MLSCEDNEAIARWLRNRQAAADREVTPKKETPKDGAVSRLRVSQICSRSSVHPTLQARFRVQSEGRSRDVTSANGGTVNEGSVTFTIINPNGANLTATGSVSAGAATATLKLPNNFAPGTYVYLAGYSDSNNGNGVPNYAADNGASTADPPSGSNTATLTVVKAPTGNPPGDSGSAPTPTAPAGSLSLFAIGWGPTGIDLFEVDSQGDIFAQSLFGGALQLVNTSPLLPLVLRGNEGLLAVIVADYGQDYFIDVFNPLLPSIESAILAGMHS